MKVKFALSLAGHDRGRYYVLLEEHREEGYVLLADGLRKPMEQPKRKNFRHIQVIGRLPCETAQFLEGEEVLTDLVIRRALKLYAAHRKAGEEEIES